MAEAGRDGIELDSLRMTRARIFYVGLFLAAVVGAAVLLSPNEDTLVRELSEVLDEMHSFVTAHPMLAGALYFLAATLGKVSPFPGSVLTLLLGGMFFGPIVGPVLGAFAAGLAAVLVGWIGIRWIGDHVRGAVQRRLPGTSEKLRADALSWLLAFRFFPVIPAWLVNFFPVVVALSLPRVFAVTVIGALPFAIVVCGIGAKLGDIVRARENVAVALTSPSTILLFVCLLIFALAPVAYRRYIRDSRASSDSPV